MFKNHQDDNKQYQLQEEKFENLFGGWEIGLTEAVEKEKGKQIRCRKVNGQIFLSGKKKEKFSPYRCKGLQEVTLQ